MSQLARLGSNSLKEVVDEGVHDGHGLGRHASIRMHLLQHLYKLCGITQPSIIMYLVDVDGVRLLPLALSLLLVALGDGLGSFARLGCSFSRSLGRHFSVLTLQEGCG